MEKYEQGTRKGSGARVRSYTGSDRLGCRLSCKSATPYNRVVSGCIIPVDANEELEYETQRGVVVRNASIRSKEVRAYSAVTMVISTPAPTQMEVHRFQISRPEVAELIAHPNRIHDRTRHGRKNQRIIQEVILEMKPLFNRKLWNKYASGELNEIELLRAANFIGKPPVSRSKNHPKTLVAHY